MIETIPTQHLPAVERTDDEPQWRQMFCSACGGKLARVALQPGSYVEDRCHHSVVVDGKRRTCGARTRTSFTR